MSPWADGLLRLYISAKKDLISIVLAHPRTLKGSLINHLYKPPSDAKTRHLSTKRLIYSPIYAYTKLKHCILLDFSNRDKLEDYLDKNDLSHSEITTQNGR